MATLTITGNEAGALIGSGGYFNPRIVGGQPPYTLALLSGSMSSGRYLQGLRVGGYYYATGTFTYTLRATDSLGATADLAVTSNVGLTASALPALTLGGATPDATVGTYYEARPTVNGGLGAHRYSLMAGASLQGLVHDSKGVLYGIPTSAGAVSATQVAVDQMGNTPFARLVLTWRHRVRHWL